MTWFSAKISMARTDILSRTVWEIWSSINSEAIPWTRLQTLTAITSAGPGFRIPGRLAGLDDLNHQAESLFRHFHKGRVILFLLNHARKRDLEMLRVVERKINISPGGFHKLAERVLQVALPGGIQLLVEPPVAFGGDGRDQRLFVGKVGVGGRVADPGFAGHFAQAQPADALLGQDLRARFDQGIFQIAMMVFFLSS